MGSVLQWCFAQPRPVLQGNHKAWSTCKRFVFKSLGYVMRCANPLRSYKQKKWRDVYITICRKEYTWHIAARKLPYSNVSRTKYGNILSLNTHFLQCSYQNCDPFDRWRENGHLVNAGDFGVRKELCTPFFNRMWWSSLVTPSISFLYMCTCPTGQFFYAQTEERVADSYEENEGKCFGVRELCTTKSRLLRLFFSNKRSLSNCMHFFYIDNQRQTSCQRFGARSSDFDGVLDEEQWHLKSVSDSELV